MAPQRPPSGDSGGAWPNDKPTGTEQSPSKVLNKGAVGIDVGSYHSTSSSASDRLAVLLARAEPLTLADGGGMEPADVAVLVSELRRRHSVQRVYRWVAIGLLVAVLAMAAALCGTTFAVVQLSRETKVTQFDNSTFQFLTTSSGLPAAVGGASLDISGMTFQPEQAREASLVGAVAGVGSGSRRRMQEGTAAAANSSWMYVGTLPHGTIALGCNIVSQNIDTFAISTTNTSLLINGTALSNIRVLEHSGCGGGGEDSHAPALIVLAAGGNSTYYVHCDDEHAGGCDVWKDVTNDPVHGTAAHRRRLQEQPQDEEQEESLSGRWTLVQHFSTEGTLVERRQLAAKDLLCYIQFHGLLLGTVCYLIQTDVITQNCFPTDATVEVQGRGRVSMAELRYGDLVRSVDRSTGALVHRPVYLFGHREVGGRNPYVHITAAGRTVAASPGHFIPVCVARCTEAKAASLENRRAADIRIGDMVAVDSSNSVPEFAVVSHLTTLAAQGAFNPYIRGADLIVDGVRASPHSDWLMDSIAPAWLVTYLPALYEAFLAPVYGLYCIVGPRTAEWLAHGLGLAESGAASSYGAGYLAVLAGMAAPLVVAVAAMIVLTSSTAAASSRAGRAAVKKAA